jgi:hypothetical protein
MEVFEFGNQDLSPFDLCANMIPHHVHKFPVEPTIVGTHGISMAQPSLKTQLISHSLTFFFFAT